MKTPQSINILIPAMALLFLSSSVNAAPKKAVSVSAGIQATARVVPSQGGTITPIDLPTSGEIENHAFWLWLSDNDRLQVQVEADGRAVGSRVLNYKAGPPEMSTLEHHRRNGQVRQRLEIDSLPAGAVTCTVTIVNPTN